MDTLQDNVIGELTFKYGWIKSIPVQWGPQTNNLKFKFKSNSSQGLSEFQQHTYQNIIADMPQVFQKSAQQLLDFCKKVYDSSLTEESIMSATTPVTILVYRENVWGILFRCKWESEINLAVKFDGDKIECGVDDILL